MKIRLCLALILCCSILQAASLEKDFKNPPPSARPWVYWFWLNGNITKDGITADLEAMKRVGIGGVLIMEVDQGAPVGPVDFMSPQWREMFKHVVSEAKRLGLEVNMNNDAGWNGSGGPWIKPEESMQKVVFGETDLEGPKHFEGVLPQPETVAGFYKDITVLAFPTPGTYRIPDIQFRAAYRVGGVGPMADSNLPPEMVVPKDRIVDVSAQMDNTGKLAWDVPPGKWTIVRFGHTSTGAENSPAPATGRGLECDKLSKEGSEASFNGMMAKLVADSRVSGMSNGSWPMANGRNETSAVPHQPSAINHQPSGLVATHVDSWENGSQNWTARMREEFQTRRGYDLLPYLPVMTGRVVGSQEISDRFLWDLRRTISELVVENYAGHIRQLAHDNGLRFTIEAYGSPCDNIPYAGMADEPMGEFWDPGGAMETCRGMASAAHVYGKPIVGAEAFTAGGQERWLHYPASIKALGDQAFCQGINRFVFHRYAMQPWTDNRVPGMTMGPWGQHYERTETWWELTPAWHKYLARCQYLLRQGLFVADICYLQAEAPPQSVRGIRHEGFDWDECSSEVVLDRMSVKDGRIVLPDGMSYKVLALSDSRMMKPRLLRKIKDLVEAGATIVGPKPLRSPSLSDYPKCDEEVKSLAAELWGDFAAVGEKPVGKGWVVWGNTPEQVLAHLGVRSDFSSSQRLTYIHRVVSGTDIFFVANPQSRSVTTTGVFRINGKIPELWWPDTGRIEKAAMYEVKDGMTNVLLQLDPSGSVFVVFRKPIGNTDHVVNVTLNGKPVFEERLPKVVLEKAVYGILDDPQRTRDVRDKLQKILDSGQGSFQVSEMAAGDDPAYGVVKTLVLDYTVDGKSVSATGTDPETIDFASPPGSELPCEIHGDALIALQPGRFTLVRSSGKKVEITVPALPSPMEINGPWLVTFPPRTGAPDAITLDRLISLSEHADSGVKYFSGTAVYHKTFDLPEGILAMGCSINLDLGDVQVIAQVKLNGKDMGVIWKPPFVVDVSDALKAGKNDLEVKVTNLWINRMIGDEELAEDSDRNPNGTLKSWPQWLLDGKPSPTGRYTFTSWRLWKKGAVPPKSGLLGPVVLKSAYVTAIK